jgi:hypothetical protein
MMKLKIAVVAIFSLVLINNDWADTPPTIIGQLPQATSNVIYTAVPFLTISPDARGGSMGDLGVATKPDANSMHWNPAKYAFMDDSWGFSSSYSPWLQNLAPDIRLLYLSWYDKLDKFQTIAFAIRYFSLGQIIFTDIYNAPAGSKTPNEFSLDGAYSRLFSETFSMGIAFRFIRSDLSSGSYTPGIEPTKAGVTAAVDISAYYKKPLQVNNQAAEIAFGLNISNIGNKISYSESEQPEFIPTNLRLGSAYTMTLDPYNKLVLSTDLNKLLVPTPPIIVTDSNGVQTRIKGMDPNVSVMQGMIQSLYDAPGGASEKLKEITISVGSEYWYRDQFAIRGGYFNESAMKGNRKYFTVGFGLKMTLLTLDFSYLVPTAGRSNPLANTMRFSASVNIGKPKKQQLPKN